MTLPHNYTLPGEATCTYAVHQALPREATCTLCGKRYPGKLYTCTLCGVFLLAMERISLKDPVVENGLIKKDLHGLQVTFVRAISV